jgi:hypothetical protein
VRGVQSDDARTGDRTAPELAHFGEELGMAEVSAGDDVKKDGENVWISRMSIDLA